MQSNGNIVVLVLGASGSGKSLLVREATNDGTVVVGEEGAMEPVTQNVKSSKVKTRPSLVFIDTPAPANDRLEARLFNAISDELRRQLKGNGRIGCVVYCLGQTRPLRPQHVENGLCDVSRLTVKHPKLQGAALIFAALQQDDEQSATISVGPIVKKRGFKAKLVSRTPCTQVGSLKNLVLKQCDDSSELDVSLASNKCWGQVRWPWSTNRGTSGM